MRQVHIYQGRGRQVKAQIRDSLINLGVKGINLQVPVAFFKMKSRVTSSIKVNKKIKYEKVVYMCIFKTRIKPLYLKMNCPLCRSIYRITFLY